MFLNGLSIGKKTQDWNYHRKARCWISSNNEMTIVQLTGFSNWLQKGDYLNVFFINLKFCDEIGKVCRVRVTFNNMYHHDENFVLNDKKVHLGIVEPSNSYIPSNAFKYKAE